MILQKLHFCEKYDSPVLRYSFSSAQNALNQSECSSLWSTTSLGGVNIYLRILHRDNHKGKVESETTILTQSLDIPIVSEFSKVLILKSLDYSWSSFYTKFIILNINLLFFFLKKTLWPRLMDGVQLPHFTNHWKMKAWVDLKATNQTCTETQKIAKLLWSEM